MKTTILALDLGQTRIGVAIGLPAATMALPKCVITRKNRQTDLEALLQIAQEENANAWVVGLPRQADDSLGPSAMKAISFAKRLKHVSRLPLYFVDEWETTVEAQQIMLAADASRRKRRQNVDKLAACLILERYFQNGPLDINID